MATAEPTLGPGDPFWLLVPAYLEIEQVRQFAREKFGHEPHFRVQIGPPAVADDGTSLVMPISAIDDEVLLGSTGHQMPGAGQYIIIACLKN